MKLAEKTQLARLLPIKKLVKQLLGVSEKKQRGILIIYCIRIPLY